MAEIRISHGQNGKPYFTTKFDHKITVLTNDHVADSRLSVAMVDFLTIDHGSNSRVSWSWSVPLYPPRFTISQSLNIDAITLLNYHFLISERPSSHIDRDRF